MMDMEDVLFRPVMEDKLKAESLIDGTVDLAYIFLINEALDVQSENQARWENHLRSKGKREI